MKTIEMNFKNCEIIDYDNYIRVHHNTTHRYVHVLGLAEAYYVAYLLELENVVFTMVNEDNSKMVFGKKNK